ncbi:MAG: CHAT domain-containing protein [Caldilinea sp. CFX5]|nr:CHAT domain-containing protein [Caldilinea sp. CFX5]
MNKLIGVLASPNIFNSSEFRSLNHRAEAMELANTLRQFWPAQSGTDMSTFTGSFSREELMTALHKAVQKTKSDDIFFFYYAGHGFTRDNESFLVVSNSRINSPSNTCIALSEIVPLLAPLRKKLIIIDACKAGGVVSQGFALSTLSVLPVISEFASDRFTALVSAASAHENSLVGVFTDSFISILASISATAEQVDILEFLVRIKQEVSIRTNGRQNPSISFSGSPVIVDFASSNHEQRDSRSHSSTPTRDNIRRGDTMKQINVLAIFANPKGSNPLRLEHEDRVIRESTRLSLNRDNIHLDIMHAARIDDFARALLDKDYQIVHFSGHGTGRGLAFENSLQEVQVVPKDALAESLMAYSPPIECVLLNSCYSDVHAQDLSVGVPYTIVMSGPISDEGATEFTRGFYDAIGAGKNIEFAYKEGCRRIKLKNLPDGLTPVLIPKSVN